MQLAEHVEANGSDEVLQRRRAPAGLLLEMIIVTVNRRDSDGIFIEADDCALLHQVAIVIDARALRLLLIKNAKLPRAMVAGNMTIYLLRTVQRFVNLFGRDR